LGLRAVPFLNRKDQWLCPCRLRLSRNHAVETQVFAWSFWARTSSRGASRSMKDMRRTSLLALPKNPRRNHLRFYYIVTA
jgi:hypothetical protein